MKYTHRFVLALFFVFAIGCAKGEEGTSKPAPEPESLYKGQTRALEKAKDLENLTEQSLQKKSKTLDSGDE